MPDHVGGSPDDLRVHIGPHSIGRCEFDHVADGRTQCVQEIGRKRAKILVKYDDALGRRASGNRTIGTVTAYFSHPWDPRSGT